MEHASPAYPTSTRSGSLYERRCVTPFIESSEEDVFGQFEEKPEKRLEFHRFSPSAYKKYATCAMQFRLVNIDRAAQPFSAFFHFGRTWDDSLNYNYENKRQSGKDLPKGDVQDYFISKWDSEKDKVDDWADENPKEMREEGPRAVAVYHKEVAPTLFPEEIQKKREARFSNTPLVLVGVPDVVERAGTIVDNKTAKRAKQESMLQEPQPFFYSLLKDLGTDKPREFRFDILVRNKKGPKIQQLKTTITHQNREAVLRNVVAAHASINRALQTGEPFLPTAFYRGGFECGYCPVADLCRKITGLPIPQSELTEMPQANPDQARNKEIVERVREDLSKGSDEYRNITI